MADGGFHRQEGAPVCGRTGRSWARNSGAGPGRSVPRQSGCRAGGVRDRALCWLSGFRVAKVAVRPVDPGGSFVLWAGEPRVAQGFEVGQSSSINCLASAIRVVSSRAASWTLIGNWSGPRWMGRAIAGWPVTFHNAV